LTLTGAVASLERPQAGEAALEIVGLVRRFGEREALAGVDVTLARGGTLAVFGPNGAGKTTLLRVIASLLRPHAGSVRVLGHELPRDAFAVRPLVGFLGHDPLLYRELTGRENLAFYARLYGVEDSERRIVELLAQVGVEARADERIATLSRGTVQRLAVCRAVLHRPSLLLLDEPRAGLDPDAIELVEPLIGRGCGATRVLVTHDLESGLLEADRVLGLRDGIARIEDAAERADALALRALYRGQNERERA
jgi:heme exporter protein A